MPISSVPDSVSPLPGSAVLVAAGALVDSLEHPRALLVARRSAPAHLAGLFEFPGGKVEIGEPVEEAVHRELREELGVQVRLGPEVLPAGQSSTRQVEFAGWPLASGAHMRVWLGEITAGTPQPLEDHDQLRWVSLTTSEVNKLPWIPADIPIVEAVRALGSSGH